MTFIAEALSRKELRMLAMQVRRIVGYEKELYFPIVEFSELIMPTLFPAFFLEIVPKECFSESKHGETDIVHGCIRIREDVYYGAADGNGRDRMTLAHEVAHYLLHVVCGIRLSRCFRHNKVLLYCDPEWQAKALAGEILCTAALIKDLPVEAIMKNCGVSRQAAAYNLRKAKEAI